MITARKQLLATDGRLGGIADWDWDSILKWIREFFIPAMRAILPLVILFLGTHPSDENK